MRKKLQTALLCLIFFATLGFAGARFQDVVFPPEAIKAMDSTRMVFYLIEYYNAFGLKQTGHKRACGIYLGDNLILGVYHLGNDVPIGGQFAIRLPFGDEMRDIELIPLKVAPVHDLALFCFEGDAPSLEPIILADKFTIGEDIMIVGHSGMPNPRFNKLMYKENGNGGAILFEPGNFGDSGGGIFNMEAELLGIISATWDQKMSQTVGYAVPLETIRKFLE